MGTKHALVLPVLLQSHFFSIYRHAVELAKRGITVTFAGLGRDINLLKTFLKTSDELQGLDFRLLSYKDFGAEHHFQPPGDPLLDGLAFTPVGWKCFRPVLDKLLADQKAGLPGPSCIIADWLLTWASDAAEELGIPYYQHYSSGAIYARELQARASLFDDGILSLEEGMGPLGPVKFLTKFEGFLRRMRESSVRRILESAGLLYGTGPYNNVVLGSLQNSKAGLVEILIVRWRIY